MNDNYNRNCIKSRRDKCPLADDCYGLMDDDDDCKCRLSDYNKGRAEAIEDISRAMHHECFEVSHEEDGLQKWDGGNWIRYKLFEKVIERLKEQRNGENN